MSTKIRWRWILLGSLLLLGSGVGFQLAFNQKGRDVNPNGEKKLGPPLFQDMTADSGVKFGYRNDFDGDPGANPKWDGHFAILDSLGGGLGLIDFDGDGLLDIFVAG